MNHQFNVGDKVVNLRNIALWDHPNHNSLFLNSVVSFVAKADSQHFTIRSNVDISNVEQSTSTDKDDIYEQDTGVCVGMNPNFILHPVRDRDVILASLDKALNASMQSLEERYLRKIPSKDMPMSDLMSYIEGMRGDVHFYATHAQIVKERYNEVINKIFN